MVNRSIVTLIFILVFVSIILTIICLKFKYKQKNLLEDNMVLEELFLSKQKDFIDLNTLYAHNIQRQLNTSLTIKTIDDFIRPWETISDHNNIYYVFNEVNCSDCIIEDINTLKQLPTEIQDRIVILSDYKNPQDLSKFMRLNQIQYPIFLINKEQFKNSFKTSLPFFYTVDENHRILSFYISVDNDEQTIKSFIDNCNWK